MPIKRLHLFQCDFCNYADSKEVKGEGVPAPPSGWRMWFDIDKMKLMVRCGSERCALLAGERKPTEKDHLIYPELKYMMKYPTVEERKHYSGRDDDQPVFPV